MWKGNAPARFSVKVCKKNVSLKLNICQVDSEGIGLPLQFFLNKEICERAQIVLGLIQTLSLLTSLIGRIVVFHSNT